MIDAGPAVAGLLLLAYCKIKYSLVLSLQCKALETIETDSCETEPIWFDQV